MVSSYTFNILNMMDEVVVVENDDSENSIIELEAPEKPPPLVINIEEDEDLILNIKTENQESLLTKDMMKGGDDWIDEEEDHEAWIYQGDEDFNYSEDVEEYNYRDDEEWYEQRNNEWDDEDYEMNGQKEDEWNDKENDKSQDETGDSGNDTDNDKVKDKKDEKRKQKKNDKAKDKMDKERKRKKNNNARDKKDEERKKRKIEKKDKNNDGGNNDKANEDEGSNDEGNNDEGNNHDGNNDEGNNDRRNNITAQDFAEQGPSSSFSLTSCSHLTSKHDGHLRAYHPEHWTSDMIKFYDEDWGNEKEFDVEKIQDKMNKDPSLWELSSKDVAYWKKRVKVSRIKCYNCLDFGHESYECTQAWREPNCHMCGLPGHLAYKCPQAVCLNCGTSTTGYVTSCKNCKYGMDKMCERCNLTGHIYSECTDHWRLYHSTTGTKRVIEPKNEIYKPNRNRWCCNCGRQGHLQVDCDHCVKNSEFSDTQPFVTSYIKAFTRSSQLSYGYEDVVKNKRIKINVSENIMSNPSSRQFFWRKNSQLRNKLKFLKKNELRRERERREREEMEAAEAMEDYF